MAARTACRQGGTDGLWQVKLAGEDPVELRTDLDIEYVRSICSALDIRIIMNMAMALLRWLASEQSHGYKISSHVYAVLPARVPVPKGSPGTSGNPVPCAGRSWCGHQPGSYDTVLMNKPSY